MKSVTFVPGPVATAAREIKMEAGSFTPDDADRLLETIFAPWIASLGLKTVELGKNKALFLLPENADIALRGGPGAGVVCGQAAAALADTASVLALAGANGRFRVCTTVDLAVNFLRPMRSGEIEVAVDIESNGRTLATCRVRMREAKSPKTAALATATFLYLEEQ